MRKKENCYALMRSEISSRKVKTVDVEMDVVGRFSRTKSRYDPHSESSHAVRRIILMLTFY